MDGDSNEGKDVRAFVHVIKGQDPILTVQEKANSVGVLFPK